MNPGDEEGFDQQLGPFYETHGPEIIPSGFEEAIERLADIMGTYAVTSNLNCFPDRLTIGHYDLTKYIQEEWDRLTNPGDAAVDFPRRGFLMSSRSASQAAGRAVEEIILEKLLWKLEVDTVKAGVVHWFYDACDAGLVRKAAGIGSDDFLVELSDGRSVLVESKASFRASPEKYLDKASRQLLATCKENPSIVFVVVGLTDLTKKTIKFVGLSTSSFVGSPLATLRAELNSL